MDDVEISSLIEWLNSWGSGPNWSDPTGRTVPVAKDTLYRLLWEARFRGGHPHDFSDLLFVRGAPDESRDAYHACSCGWVRHVYTFAPLDIRHENYVPPEQRPDLERAFEAMGRQG
jgi:hypothetical protein